MNIKYTLFATVLFMISSCDVMVAYEFGVKNSTEKNLVLIYAVSLKKDTTTIAPGEIKVIARASNVSKPGDDYYKNMKNIFYYLHLTQQNKETLIDLTDRNLWTLQWKQRDSGYYQLEVDSTFFSRK
jgi:hypothetical protein